MNIKRLINQKLLKSELLKNTSVLISGTALAQLIPILLQPVLRRHFAPETFGSYAVYLSIVGILIMVSSFKYELAIVLPKKNKEAANIIALSQLYNLFFNLLILVIVLCFKSSIIRFLNIPVEYSLFLIFVPLGTFLYNLYTSINYWLIRQKAFTSISINKILRRSGEGLAQLLFILGNVNLGLLFGDILGHITNIISGVIQIKKKKFNLNFLSWQKIRYVQKKYIEYPRYNLIPSFMSASSYLLPAIFINKFFSAENTGYFDLSKLLLSIPLALIATSISNVLLQRITESSNLKLSLKKDIYTIAIIVFSIALFEVLVIQLWGRQLFVLFFGENWVVSGEIASLLVWSFTFNFITASFTSIFIALKKIKLLSLWQILYFIAILCLTFFRNSSFFKFLKVYVSIEVFCYSLMTVVILYVIISYEKKCLSTQK